MKISYRLWCQEEWPPFQAANMTGLDERLTIQLGSPRSYAPTSSFTDRKGPLSYTSFCDCACLDTSVLKTKNLQNSLSLFTELSPNPYKWTLNRFGLSTFCTLIEIPIGAHIQFEFGSLGRAPVLNFT